MILECWFYMFRGIYRHLINAQEQIYSRFVQNVKLVKPTFSTRRGDTRTTAWACATCLLFENLLPVASYSRRVSDLKVPNSRRARTHKKNSGDAVRRLGAHKAFFVPNQEPTFAWPFGNGPARVEPRGFSACAWKLSSRLFSRPDWPPLGFRGWSEIWTSTLLKLVY